MPHTPNDFFGHPSNVFGQTSPQRGAAQPTPTLGLGGGGGNPAAPPPGQPPRGFQWTWNGGAQKWELTQTRADPGLTQPALSPQELAERTRTRQIDTIPLRPGETQTLDPITGRATIFRGQPTPEISEAELLASLRALQGAGGGEAPPLPPLRPPRPINLPGPLDEGPAQRAAFGRAAERTADVTQGALRGLDQALGASGFGEAPGGGAELAVRGGIIGEGARNLSNVTREQALESLRRGQDVNDRNVGARLTERGQTGTFLTNVRGQDTVARGQDIAGQTARSAQVPALAQLLLKGKRLF